MSDKLTGVHDLRLIILSAHDTLIAMLLTALSLKQSEAPPFATTLIFELWTTTGASREPYVKLLYNDKALDLSVFCQQDTKNKTCSFSKFQAMLLDGTYTDMRGECSNDNSFNEALIVWLSALLLAILFGFGLRHINKAKALHRDELVEEI